jgi:hypothetical protein
VQELDQDLRVELKTLYIDPEDVQMRAAAAAREPAARFRVHGSQVRPHEDALMVLAYRLDPLAEDPDTFCPRVIDIGVFSAYDCVEARDKSLYENGGRWFGETPVVVSRRGAARLLRGEALDTTRYGRKEAEGADFNEHTNFGKLRRIPHKPLQQFLAQHGAAHLQSGNYPRPWHL